MVVVAPKDYIAAVSRLFSLLGTNNHPPVYRICGGWPSSYLPSVGCEQVHVGPHSAVAAAAKISTAALEETSRQDPEAGLGLDHFTLKIARGLLPGGECLLLWVPIQLYCDLFVHFQTGMCYKDRIFITAPQEKHNTSLSPQPRQSRGPESRTQYERCCHYALQVPLTFQCCT